MAWGALVGVLSIALASQLTHRRDLVVSTPPMAEAEVPGAGHLDAAQPDTDPTLPAADTAPSGGAPVVVAAPEAPPAAPAVPETGSAPAPAPEQAAAPEPAQGAEQSAAAGDAAPAPAAPVPEAAPSAEAAPTAAEAPAVETAPIALPQPSPVTAPAEVAQPAAPGASDTDGPRVPAAADPVRTAAAVPGAVPEAPAAPPAVVTGSVTAPVAPAIPEAGLDPLRPAEAPPGIAAATALPAVQVSDAPPAAGSAAPAPPPAEPTLAAEPVAPEAPAADAAAPQDTGLPAPGFQGADGVRVNRLPRIGDEESPAPAPEAAPEETAEVAPDPDAPAIVRNAVPFENPDLRPVVAVVLFHDEPEAPQAATGRDLPVPVSFAVDAGLVEAGVIADAYRAAGREILIVPTLPPGGAASDVEVALQVNFDVMPEAVALMDLPQGGFQSEREAVAQVVASLSVTGHGLVTFPRGLNMAQQMAERAGVPARPVFRLLESANVEAALRTLEQAAFRARQEGTVILVGRAEPATVEAIRRWTEFNPDADILFAPISAALAAAQ
jgi:polysaccharide deacetylase 2 family uncharacterized protein YibQ